MGEEWAEETNGGAEVSVIFSDRKGFNLPSHTKKRVFIIDVMITRKFLPAACVGCIFPRVAVVVVVVVVVAFSSLARISGECSTIHFLPALFLSPCLRLFFFFFFDVQISSRTLIPLFMPGSVHSGSAG